MNVFRPIGIAGLAWRDAARGLGRPDVWWPVATLSGLEVALVLLMLGFASPLVLPVALPLVRLLGGETATHYPAHLYALPAMFEEAMRVPRALLLPIVAAAVSLRFAVFYGVLARDVSPSLGRSTLLPLLTIGALVLAVPAAIDALLELAASRVVPSLAAARPRVSATVTVLTFGLLVYAVCAIALRRKGLFGAFREAARRASSFAVPTILIVAVPLALLHPLAVALPRADLQGASLRPELTIVLLAIRIALEAVVIVLVMGASTRLFVTRRGDRR